MPCIKVQEHRIFKPIGYRGRLQVIQHVCTRVLAGATSTTHPTTGENRETRGRGKTLLALNLYSKRTTSTGSMKKASTCKSN